MIVLYRRYRVLQKSRPDLWEHFTRKEEYNPAFRDCFDRFPYYLSRTRDIFRPKVSEFLKNSGYRPEYPDGKPFAVCLTHDIDMVYRNASSKGIDIAKSLVKGRIAESKHYLRELSDKRHPLCNFEEIMDLEERCGATSSFYFLALHTGDQDYAYDIMDVQDDLRAIRDRGWEVGLHGGHEAYGSCEQVRKEKMRLENALGSKVIGYRNHYLRFRVPDTWEHLAEAGFHYDTTFGYADCSGFRNGMCHPFHPYNLHTEAFIDIIEIPLAVMDCALLHPYMKFDYGTALRCVQSLIDNVAESNGVVTILWHNTNLLRDTHERKLYEKILDYCTGKNAWMTSGDHVVTNLENCKDV